MKALEQIQLIEKRHLLQTSLAMFVKDAWEHIDPSPLQWNWHHDAICEHIQAVYQGHIHKLAISLPPRHSKSIIISVCSPAWVWTWNPSYRLLCSSYGMGLALRDSQRCRDLIDSNWYQGYFKSVFQWMGDQNRLQRYENTKRGYRITTSVEGAATGEGADALICLSGDTKIQTDKGELVIRAIVDEKLAVNVLSYNHMHDKLEYKAIEAYEKNQGKEVVRVVCADDTSFVCTNDHPVYVVGKGYTQAQFVKAGDYVKKYTSDNSVQSLREAGKKKIVTSKSAQSVLQQAVFRCLANNKHRENMRNMWKNILRRTKGQHETFGTLLFDRMQKVTKGGSTSTVCPENNSAMRDMQSPIRDIAKSGRKAQILFTEMCKYSAQGTHQGGKQSALCRWWMDKSRTSIPKRFLRCGPISEGTGWDVYALWDDQRSLRQRDGCAPYRLQQAEYRYEQFGNTLPFLSWEDAWGQSTTGTVDTVLVTGIECDVTPEYVYNLRIADNHNYFANGILTHNCDDAHNVKEIESDAIRKGTLRWWDTVMNSRLNDQQTGGMIIIGHRVHAEDLIGHVLQQGGWEYLCLPAEYEPSKKTFTSIGWSDPRTEEGQPLWEEKFPKIVLDSLKVILQLQYYAQYQQAPTREQGNIIKAQTLLDYTDEGETYLLHAQNGDKRVLKMLCRRVVSTDFAPTASQQADYTVFLDWDITPDGEAVLLDITLGKWEVPEAEKTLDTKLRAIPRLWCVLMENVAYQVSTIQRFRKAAWPVRPHTPHGDKIARAQSIAVYFGLGYFYFNQNCINFAAYKKQLLGFPKAGNDDMVDATSIMNELYLRGEPQITAIEAGIAKEQLAIDEIRQTDAQLADFLAEGLL